MGKKQKPQKTQSIIMSIPEFRDYMKNHGAPVDYLSDEQVASILDFIYQLAQIGVNLYQKGRLPDVKQE